MDSTVHPLLPLLQIPVGSRYPLPTAARQAEFIRGIAFPTLYVIGAEKSFVGNALKARLSNLVFAHIFASKFARRWQGFAIRASPFRFVATLPDAGRQV